MAQNKKARFEYTVLEKFEAGLALFGAEVKSVRAGGANLAGTFVTFREDTAYITNLRISPYRFALADAEYDPLRSRALLLGRKEILYLREKVRTEGLTIVPLSLYTKGRLIKAEIALVRGKKKWDKRETIKKREVEREIRRRRSEI
ncbi:MAG: SsrA-binding protein [Candidatus Magasanikbacteria bacterium GW2011_GWA2_56_11]|uniref:SsrA-binding protein n=1 Tax=Candidatus Magasanikbacteria bacterium GW2011_GWA2_56_11 TaxID=1619044 RepID=A0A0G2B8P7_9BACT|nr:MAG: SsrA-binding protein [Candidatus Magasanikbacteria bacterium GW2011_GWA2_56_11]